MVTRIAAAIPAVGMITDDTCWIAVLAASEAVSVWLLWRLWRSDDHLFFKIRLSVIALLPVLGPLLVLWIGNFPDAKPRVLRDRLPRQADFYEPPSRPPPRPARHPVPGRAGPRAARSSAKWLPATQARARPQAPWPQGATARARTPPPSSRRSPRRAQRASRARATLSSSRAGTGLRRPGGRAD